MILSHRTAVRIRVGMAEGIAAKEVAIPYCSVGVVILRRAVDFLFCLTEGIFGGRMGGERSGE